jgi:hypothetical protein
MLVFSLLGARKPGDSEVEKQLTYLTMALQCTIDDIYTRLVLLLLQTLTMDRFLLVKEPLCLLLPSYSGKTLFPSLSFLDQKHHFITTRAKQAPILY